MTTTIQLYTGTSYEDIDSDKVINAKFVNSGTAALDKFECSLRRDVLDDTHSPTYSKDIRLVNDGTVIFGGKISGRETEGGILGLLCYSYGEEFLDRLVSKVYDNKDVGEIIEDVIANFTNLTYASSNSTGIIVDKIAFNKKTVAEIIEFFSKALFYRFRTDYLKNCYFEKDEAENSGVTLTVGDNVINIPLWDRNTNDVVTKITVEGGTQNFTTQDSYTASASQTDFILTYKPNAAIKVTVDGTEKQPEVESSSTGDYIVDIEEQKQIIFNTPLTGGETVVIAYTYDRPIQVEAEIYLEDDFGNQIIKERFEKKKYIKKYQEARKYAQKYLSVFGQPNKSTTLIISNFNADLVAGNIVRVIDSYEGISENFVIQGVEYKYPENQSIIYVGASNEVIYDWQKEVMNRLQELATNEQNIDVFQVNRTIIENINIDLTPTLFSYNRKVYDSWIWGTSTWGEDKWGDRREGDDFESYGGSSTYEPSDYWLFSGTTTFTEGTVILPPSNTLLYKDREGGIYANENLKLRVEFNADALGKLQVYTRYSSASDTVLLDVSKTHMELYDATTPTTTSYSVTYDELIGSQNLTIRLFENIKIYNDSGTLYFNETINNKTTSGYLLFLSNTGTAEIEKVEIYDGVDGE